MSLFDLSAKLGLDSSQYEKGLQEAEGQASSFGTKLKSGLVGAGKLAAGAVAAVSAAAVGASTALVKGASSVAVYGDGIDKMSQKMGMSTAAYQEWDAILQHSGTSIESMQRGMVTLSKAAENNKDKFAKLGITEKELATLNQEELFARTIAGLQNMESGTERTAIASELLGGSAKELGALLNTSAEDTEAMRQRVHELGGVMSEEAVKASAGFQDNLQDLQTALSGAKRGITEELLPGLSTLMAGFTDLIAGTAGADEEISAGLDSVFEGLNSGFEKVIEIGGAIIPQIVTAFLTHLPDIIPGVLGLLETIATTLVDNTPMLIQSALDILLAIGNALTGNPETLMNAAVEIIDSLALWLGEYSTVLIDTAVTLITNLVTSLTSPDSIGRIVDSAIFLILSLAEGIISAVPTLIETVPVLIENVVTTISENLPKILEAGIELLGMLVQGILDNIPLVVESFTTILETITTFITEHLPEILESGIDLLIAIMDGIIDAIPTLVEALPRVIEAIVNFVTQNLPVILETGIELLMKLAEGIIQNLPAIIQAMSTILTNLVQYIAENLPMIIQSGISLLMAIIQGMIDHLPQIIEATIDVVLAIVNALLDNLDLLIEAAIEIIVALAGGLIEAIPQLIAKIPEIISAIINAFLETDWLDIGRQIIEGIGNGIVNFASGLWQKAKDAVGGVVDSVKNFLGIHSPSRVFRDQVGKMIGMGLAEGIDKSAVEAVKSAESMAEDVLGGMEPITDLSGDLTANLASDGGYGAGAAGMTQNRSVVINVYGAEGQNINDLAEIISEKIAFGYRQEQMAWA